MNCIFISEPLPIFNVMSSSYTVPPLIGLEVEDDVPESMNVVETLEVVEDIPMESELPGTEENIDAVNTDGIEENVPCEALENLNVDRDVDDDSKLKNETPGEVSSSMGDVPDVEEEVSYNTVNVTTSDDVLDHENVEVSSSGVNDDAIEDETVIVKMEPMEQDETEFGEKPKFETVVKREPVECDERQVALDPESETFTSVLDTEDNPLLGAVVSDITSLDESLERDDRSSFLDVCVKKSPPVHSPVLHQVQVELDEDISLKESSDVLSEFAFDPVPSPNETCQPPKDSSLNTNDKDEDGHATKDNDEQTDGRSRFVVLPPVSRGTELSGLCTIM